MSKGITAGKAVVQLKKQETNYFIDPFNKFNLYSFPLLTSYSAFVILLKAYSFNDSNSGKLYILDLLKGSILQYNSAVTSELIF